MTKHVHITAAARGGTPFLAFWSALVEQCRLNGYPEPTYGAAQRAWGAAMQNVALETGAGIRRPI